MQGPNGPQGPSISPSEPEKEQVIIDTVVEQMKDSETAKIINLRVAKEFLGLFGFDLDSNGFITDGEDFVRPYSFDRDAFRESEHPVDNVFKEFFKPLNEENFPGRARDKVHLKDLHAIGKLGGNVKLIVDDTFMIERFHAMTGLALTTIMGWSDAAENSGMLKGDQLQFVFDSLGSENHEMWEINCISPGCDFSAHPDDWEGAENEPECPQCGEKWEQVLTMCNGCDEWFRGHNIVGETMYASPVCPHCGASTDKLDMQTVYDLY